MKIDRPRLQILLRAHCSASSMSKPDSFRDILSLHIPVTDLPRIHLIDNLGYMVLLTVWDLGYTSEDRSHSAT